MYLKKKKRQLFRMSGIRSLKGKVFFQLQLLSCLFLVPTGLLALQGNDPSGRIIRDKLNEMNILTDFIQGLYFK